MTWIGAQDQMKIEAFHQTCQTKISDWSERLEYAYGDHEFAMWMVLVDRQLFRRIGLGHLDVEDWVWRDSYDEGLSPKEASISALTELGYIDVTLVGEVRG